MENLLQGKKQLNYLQLKNTKFSILIIIFLFSILLLIRAKTHKDLFYIEIFKKNYK